MKKNLFLKHANAGIKQIKPYFPAKPVNELKKDLGLKKIIMLGNNENPLGPNPKAIKAIQKATSSIADYPDSGGIFLKNKIAKKFKGELNFSENQIVLGNGSSEIISLLAQAFLNNDNEVIFSKHAFIVYKLASQLQNTKIKEIPSLNWGADLEAMLAAITDKTRLIFIANPNNPTGTFISKNDLTAFIEQVPPEIILVIDEAYCEYVADPTFTSMLPWLDKYPNIVVVRTFSKAYGLAGLRIGYSISCPNIANILNRIRSAVNINHLALIAASVCIDDDTYLKKTFANNKFGMQQITNSLKKMGIDYIPSAANFIAIRFGKNAALLHTKLINHGIILCPLDSYEMSEYLRVTIGLPWQNKRFLETIQKL